MTNTFIIRYHRIGDALICLPLIFELAKSYPNENFTVLSNKRFECLFDLMPENITFIPAPARNSTGIFRGISYLVKRFFFERKIIQMSQKFDKIAFLQFDKLEQKIHKEILRKKLPIRIGISDETDFLSIERINTRCNDGLTMVGIHKKTFTDIGYNNIQATPIRTPFKGIETNELYHKLGIQDSVKLIAIAPFAKEEAKIYPLDKMETIIAHFASQSEKYKVLLLGGGRREKNIAEKWIEKYPDVISLIERFPYETEVLLISKCAVSLTMDSSNLHLSAFLNIPVISLWGATLPKNGYYPINVPVENALCLNLSCQPCSLFGRTECTNKVNYACFNIPPEAIIKKMEEFL